MNKLLYNKDNQWVVVGQIGRAYGIHGWIKINAFTEPYTNIMEYRPWFLQNNGYWQEVVIHHCKKHGKGLIAQLDNCETPEATKLLTNKLIGVKREQLPLLMDDKQYYWIDLIGLAVYNNDQRKYLGKVECLFETGANDVLVIKQGTNELLIPYVWDHIILNIDLPHKTMVVNWDEDY